MSSPFRSERDGIRLRLDVNEAAVLEQLLPLLATVGERSEGDPAARRLYPAAYRDAPDDDEEYWRLVGDELAEARAADRSAFAETLAVAEEGVVLSSGEAEAWLRVLGDARLLLAARLGIEREDDHDTASGSPEWAVLSYLGYLQGTLAEVMASTLPTSHG